MLARSADTRDWLREPETKQRLLRLAIMLMAQGQLGGGHLRMVVTNLFAKLRASTGAPKPAARAAVSAKQAEDEREAQLDEFYIQSAFNWRDLGFMGLLQPQQRGSDRGMRRGTSHRPQHTRDVAFAPRIIRVQPKTA